MLYLCALGWLALAAANAQMPAPKTAVVKTGIDILEEDGFKELQGKRIGLITNKTGKDSAGRSTLEILAAAPNVQLISVFEPEHGYLIDNDTTSFITIQIGGRPITVYSLHQNTKSSIARMRPDPEQFKNLDAVVFDVQDIGARSYTYLTAMALALDVATKTNTQFIVLDRPNPLTGTIVEGPILDDLSLRQKSPSAYFPMPLRHGMTAGEIALLYNAEVKSPKLTVIRMTGWSRNLWYDETGLPWTQPSPNIPDLTAAILYPGIGIFEATNLSVGRGTPWPFQWIGAPWLDAQKLLKILNAAKLPGIRFAVQDYVPAKAPNSLYAGERCHGVRLIINDRNQLRSMAIFAQTVHALLPMHPKDFKIKWTGVKAMVGTDKFQKLIEQGATFKEIQTMFDAGANDFKKIREPYLLY